MHLSRKSPISVPTRPLGQSSLDDYPLGGSGRGGTLQRLTAGGSHLLQCPRVEHLQNRDQDILRVLVQSVRT